jgi:hypothetical protein
LGDRGGSTRWDSSFENEFDRADSHFPTVISWLEGLDRRYVEADQLRDRFVAHSAAKQQLRLLTECVVSLAVRSPMNREASAPAERLRGLLHKRDRETVSALNMRHSQRLASDNIGANAKFAVLFASGKEFIFGGGFFHNLTAVVNPPQQPVIIAPITPNVTVVIMRPMSYMTEPRLSTLVLNEAEVELCNHGVQVYSRNALFFRRDQPDIDDAFARGQHLRYSNRDNP